MKNIGWKVLIVGNEIIEDTSYYKNDPALVIEMDAIKNGTFTGVAVFPKMILLSGKLSIRRCLPVLY